MSKWTLNPFSLMGQISESRYWAYFLIAPSLIMVAAVILYPTLSAIKLSFQDMNLVLNPFDHPFIGLDNYITLLTEDSVFWVAVRNTIIWTGSAVTIELVIGMVTALALTQPLPGMKLLASLLIIPWVLPAVVAGNTWALMLDPRLGIINNVLTELGWIEGYKAWFSDPATALPMVIGIEVWHGFPFFTLLLMAGLKGIPNDLYEAGNIDGTNTWQAFWHITLPMLKTIIMASVILRVISLFNSPTMILILTNGGPGDSTEVLSLYAFHKAYLEFDFGYSSTISVVMFMALMVFCYFYVKISKSKG